MTVFYFFLHTIDINKWVNYYDCPARQDFPICNNEAGTSVHNM